MQTLLSKPHFSTLATAAALVHACAIGRKCKCVNAMYVAVVRQSICTPIFSEGHGAADGAVTMPLILSTENNRRARICHQHLVQALDTSTLLGYVVRRGPGSVADAMLPFQLLMSFKNMVAFNKYTGNNYVDRMASYMAHTERMRSDCHTTPAVNVVHGQKRPRRGDTIV